MRELRPKRLLAIFAHPDDESFAAGGMLAKYAAQDVQVVLLCATRGEAGIPGLSPEETGEIRERELRQAAKHLGIEVYFLGYRDGELANLPGAPLLASIAGWMDLVQPQVILTFGPDGVSGHPDHKVISQAATQAYDQTYRKGMLLYIHPSEATALGCGVTSAQTDSAQPLIAIDISDYKLNKIRAIQSHASQNPGLPGKPQAELDDLPCHEVYRIARQGALADHDFRWFEPQREAQGV